MNSTVRRDLTDLTDCLESIKKNLAKLSQAEKIDVASRTNAACKLAEEITGKIKDEIEKWCKQKPGELKGEIFKACLAYIPTTRLDQTLLKEKEPEVYNKYLKTNEQRRITFAVR